MQYTSELLILNNMIMQESKVITFREGRGGKFNNGGYLSFYKICTINEVLNIIEEETRDGILYIDGTGSIDIDGEYNSFYSIAARDLESKHFKALFESNCYESEQVLKFIIGEDFDVFKEFDLIKELIEFDSYADFKKHSNFSSLKIEEVTEIEYNDAFGDIDYKEVKGKFYRSF